MFDFTWRQAFEESGLDQTDVEERAYKAGWQAAFARIIAVLQDEHQSAEVMP